MRIATVIGTELFVGTATDPLQVVQVEVEGFAGELRVDVRGDGVSGHVSVAGTNLVEVPVVCSAAPGAGSRSSRTLTRWTST